MFEFLSVVCFYLRGWNVSHCLSLQQHISRSNTKGATELITIIVSLSFLRC